MITIKNVLLALLGGFGLVFAVRWARAATASLAAGTPRTPSPVQLAIGFVTNFFDTLGIGSFATTTTAYKMLRLVPDENIPGTLIIGHALPVAIQALIFIVIVRVDSVVLLTLIAASVVGGWLGADIVSKLPRRPIQIGMGTALLAAAGFMAATQLGLLPSGGATLGLPTDRLIIAAVVNFILGALLMLGIGNYGPCLVMLSLMGMDPRAAFPVMMSTGALVLMVGGLKFIDTGRYDLRAALGLAAGGIPAVLVAGLLVKSLPLDTLRWGVVVVVIYAAFAMLR